MWKKRNIKAKGKQPLSLGYLFYSWLLLFVFDFLGRAPALVFLPFYSLRPVHHNALVVVVVAAAASIAVGFNLGIVVRTLRRRGF